MVNVRSQRRAAPTRAMQRHYRNDKHHIDWRKPAPAHLVAKPAIAKSRHETYYEIADNTDKKKKKLELHFTRNRTPFPGFTFVPIGNPDLSEACKNLSREEGAVVYVVSEAAENGVRLGSNIHRIGYHIRSNIVERCASDLDIPQFYDNRDGAALEVLPVPNVNKIPETQAEIDAQADAAIRDLFPRIPNTDRQMIIGHSFRKGTMFANKPTVGNNPELSLARRVQLAVIAHIRHTHTRYDMLLREANWEEARKTVESLVLDILIKWRGDEETGRDQLDEVLREIVVISDSEANSDDGDNDDDDDDDGNSDNVDDHTSEGEIDDADVEDSGDDDDNDTDLAALSGEGEAQENSMATMSTALSTDPHGMPISKMQEPRATVAGSNDLNPRHLTKRSMKRRRRSERRRLHLKGSSAQAGPHCLSKESKSSARIREREARSKAKRFAAWQRALDRKEHTIRPDDCLLRVYDDSIHHNASASTLFTPSDLAGLALHASDHKAELRPPLRVHEPPGDGGIASTNQHYSIERAQSSHYQTGHINRDREKRDMILRSCNSIGVVDVPPDMPLPSIESGPERLDYPQAYYSLDDLSRARQVVNHESHDGLFISQQKPPTHNHEIVYLDDTIAAHPTRQVLRDEYATYDTSQDYATSYVSTHQSKRIRRIRVVTISDHGEHGYAPVHKLHIDRDYIRTRSHTFGYDNVNTQMAPLIYDEQQRGQVDERCVQPLTAMYGSTRQAPTYSYGESSYTQHAPSPNYGQIGRRERDVRAIPSQRLVQAGVAQQHGGVAYLDA